MKLFTTGFLLLLALATSQAQLVYVNPSSITLTKQGVVSVIVTDNASTTTADTVTVGAIQATYYNGIAYWAANQGPNVIAASGVSTGTLDAGTYSVTITGNPKQVTVILWNEDQGSSTITLQDIELAYNSASSTDQAVFQAFIATLVQQQLASLQTQITDHENRITALEGTGDEHSSEINQLQEELGTLQGNLSQLQNSYDSLDSRVTALEQQLANLSVSNGTNGSDGKNGRNADDTLAYVGMGLGGAGVVGAIINAIFDSKPEASPENK